VRARQEAQERTVGREGDLTACVHGRWAFGARLGRGWGKGQKYAVLIRAMWAGVRQTTTTMMMMTVGKVSVRMCEAAAVVVVVLVERWYLRCGILCYAILH
jgi:hypothetical protein